MIAIMAKRPLAISADSFLVFSAGPEEGSTFQPSSPGLPSEMSLLKKAGYSTKPQQAKICVRPS